MTTITTTVRNRRIEVPAPSDLPDGTEVVLIIAENRDDDALSPEEISRILVAMQNLEIWDMPEDIAADLE